CHQHEAAFRELLEAPADAFATITGETAPPDRAFLYKNRRFLFATPQTIHNDLEDRTLLLADVVLLVFDEAHHAIGGYAYPAIAARYREQARSPRVLGLTASPGGTEEKIREIMANLGISQVEARTESDPDVSPHVQEKSVEWVTVDLPERFLKARQSLQAALSSRLQRLAKLGLRKPASAITRKDLLALQIRAQAGIKRGAASAPSPRPFGGGSYFGLSSLVAQCLKIDHALTLLETQGIPMLSRYWDKLAVDSSRAAKSVLADDDIARAITITQELAAAGSRHPKVSQLCSLVAQQLREEPASRIIIFANYRDTVSELARALGSVEGAEPLEFIGQSLRKSPKSKSIPANTDFQPAAELRTAQPVEQAPSGLSQKEQQARLRQFRSGLANILICTSIGEEGLDIPEMHLAIFYETVPSAIRAIQRRGRVGRTQVGRVVVLYTRGTRDEAYHWASQRREKEMHATLHRIRNQSRL
ncbi:MAG TPA: helicase-related protein, partial [archaeon]|nr:helicase-related protein [archaeon]